jgi:hypothetical protein
MKLSSASHSDFHSCSFCSFDRSFCILVCSQIGPKNSVLRKRLRALNLNRPITRRTRRVLPSSLPAITPKARRFLPVIALYRRSPVRSIASAPLQLPNPNPNRLSIPQLPLVSPKPTQQPTSPLLLPPHPAQNPRRNRHKNQHRSPDPDQFKAPAPSPSTSHSSGMPSAASRCLYLVYVVTRLWDHWIVRLFRGLG